MRKLVYYVASTLDGFIAGPDGEIDFYPFEPDLAEFIRTRYPETLPTHLREPLGIDGPNLVFDTLVMGRGTLDPGLKAGIASPYAHMKQYVFSRSLPGGGEPSVVQDDPVEFVRGLKQQNGLDIWLCGGGDLAGQLLPEVDELVIKLSPVIAGRGVPLARRGFDPVRFTLASTAPLPSGVVVLTYTSQ
jgi:dihydrofolate reductase